MSRTEPREPAGKEASERLTVRAPLPADEAQALEAERELADDDFHFTQRRPGETWEQYLARIGKEKDGIDLAPDRVPGTMLFAFLGDELVGRVQIRHALTPWLHEVGGHIGYGVRPAYRRRGYATELLRNGLDVLRGLGVERALVTCDDDNLGSSRVIERCGGVLENTVSVTGAAPKRRYWIELG